mgnify:CR=1 FL=1
MNGKSTNDNENEDHHGWFEKTIWWLSKKDVGAISGVEEIRKTRGGFETYYRGTADKLRIKESGIFSTPILEAF